MVRVYECMMGLMSSLVAIPIVGQIQPEGWVEKLGKASAQFVLAAACVALAVALVKTMKQVQANWEARVTTELNTREVLLKITNESSTAMQRQADSAEGLSSAVHDLTAAIDKCKK